MIRAICCYLVTAALFSAGLSWMIACMVTSATYKYELLVPKTRRATQRYLRFRIFQTQLIRQLVQQLVSHGWCCHIGIDLHCCNSRLHGEKTQRFFFHWVPMMMLNSPGCLYASSILPWLFQAALLVIQSNSLPARLWTSSSSPGLDVYATARHSYAKKKTKEAVVVVVLAVAVVVGEMQMTTTNDNYWQK